MKMKKLISVALTTALALSACVLAPVTAQAAKALEEGDLIGIVLPTKEESRWLNDERYFNDIFTEKGYNYEILFSQNNSATERTNVETLISRGAKVIVLCAYDATAAASALSDEEFDEITAISYDRLIMGTDRLDYYVIRVTLSLCP